jgi:hypothetical protein
MVTDEMIERAAAAMFSHGDEGMWEALSKNRREFWRSYAREALEAALSAAEPVKPYGYVYESTVCYFDGRSPQRKVDFSYTKKNISDDDIEEFEISETAVYSALSAQVQDVAGLESNPVTLRWWCQQLLDIIENYDISHDSCDEEIALINDIRSSVDPAAPAKQEASHVTSK